MSPFVCHSRITPTNRVLTNSLQPSSYTLLQQHCRVAIDHRINLEIANITFALSTPLSLLHIGP